MKAIMLALHDYQNHMTDEGRQLQEGLCMAGVELWGTGYANAETHVPAILDAAQPDVVIVADPRDWTASMPGCWDKQAEFTEIDALRDVPTIVVFKDAASCPDFQRGFHARVNADALICYYHPLSVCSAALWVDPEKVIRTYHTIDAEAIPPFGRERGGAIISGARGGYVYPMREAICERARDWGVHVLAHPGYGNRGCSVRDYYRLLNRYKVSIATASRYGFALRKIIEDVACGCTVLTDLPRYDRLPIIDAALVDITPTDCAARIADALRLWTPAIAQQWSWAARARYHYPIECHRLYAEIARRFHA